jgi:EKC/KEOPS complex subunit PCC1/LAGE3
MSDDLGEKFPVKLSVRPCELFCRLRSEWLFDSWLTSGLECRVIDVPFPDERLAKIALRALSVDKELSPLVNRTFEVVDVSGDKDAAATSKTVLTVVYRATTNRMLRVSVNGFWESLRLVVQVMEDLDVDVCGSEVKEDLTKVQVHPPFIGSMI